jgi:hypothetical protein
MIENSYFVLKFETFFLTFFQPKEDCLTDLNNQIMKINQKKFSR